MSSSCAIVPEQALLEALENGEEGVFLDALNSETLGDVNKIYPDPICASVLEIASERGLIVYVSMLLNHPDINVDLRNPSKKQCAIHAALANGHARVAKLLIARGADVTAKNRHGRTPLHLVASVLALPNYKNADDQEQIEMRKAYLEVLQMLLKNNKTDIDGTDVSGSTAAYLAAKTQDETVLEVLVENGADIDRVCHSERRSAADLIKEFDEELYQKLSEKKSRNPKPSCSSLWEALQKSDLDSFSALASTMEDCNSFQDDRTCLHDACGRGLYDYVELLLNQGADVTLPNRSTFWTPLHYAAAHGYHRIVQLLLQKGAPVNAITSSSSTALHLLIETRDRRDVPPLSDERDVQQCLAVLLEADGIDLNLQDRRGNTPLHLAVLQGNEIIAKQLLAKGADYIIPNRNKQVAIDFISSELVEEFLDDCIQTEVADTENTTEFPIIFDYGFIAPFCPKGSDVFGEVEEKPVKFIPEVDHLWILSQNSRHLQLLKHPVIASFLNLKWQRAKKFYFINTFLYALFVILFSVVAVTLVKEAQTPVGDAGSTDNEKIIERLPHSDISAFLKTILVILTVYFTIREVFQLLVAPVRYLFHLENVMEWVMLILIFVLMDGSILSRSTWRPCLAVALFFAWVELVLMFGRHNQFSMAVKLFFNVAYEFLKLLSWYVVFILGFALTFYVLFYPTESHVTFQGTFMKTIIMMIGEIDYTSLNIEHNVVAYLVLLVFIFSITIVLMNLLTGLAVNDTQELYHHAELISYKSKLEHISYAEAMLLGDPVRYLTDYPPFDWICHCFPVAYLSNYLPITPFLNFLGKRSLVFMDSLPEKKAVIRDMDKKCPVETNDGSSLFVPLDIVNEAKMMILQRAKRDEAKRERNLKDIRHKIRNIDEKINKLTHGVEGLYALIKDQPFDWSQGFPGMRTRKDVQQVNY